MNVLKLLLGLVLLDAPCPQSPFLWCSCTHCPREVGSYAYFH